MAGFLITGGTGFIGTALVRHLVAGGHHAVVVTRHPQRHAGRFGDGVSHVGRFSDITSDSVFDVVVNLGGEGIGDKRWSDKRKAVLRQSRIGLTDHLVKCLARLEQKPAVMISGSAIGWYGAQDARPLDESSAYHPEFTHDLCQEWEVAAGAAASLGIRLCIIRLGLVLGRNGGVLKRMLPPFLFGLGGPMGSGEQTMSWVHMTDVIRAIDHLVGNASLQGAFNLTAPGAVSNTEFTRALGRALHRPTVLPMPGFMLKLLFGEMGGRLLLEGQNVVPKRLQESGFAFRHPDIDGALAEIFAR